MDLSELLKECRRKQRVSGRASIGVYLVLPDRNPDTLAQSIRLAGRAGGPLGEIANVNSEGHVVAIFPADKVIAWIQREVQRMVKEDPESAWKALQDVIEHEREIQEP